LPASRPRKTKYAQDNTDNNRHSDPDPVSAPESRDRSGIQFDLCHAIDQLRLNIGAQTGISFKALSNIFTISDFQYFHLLKILLYTAGNVG
jgi:hypothetical protein